MPNYEYRCSAGHTSEQHRSIDTRDHATACPQCGAMMTRLPAAPGFKLVGAGFYQNDYRAKQLYAEKPK
jgi:putative FmdB family regulatory protein